MPDTTDQCDISVAQYTIGQLYTPELLEEVRAKADGAPVRVTGPKFASDRKRVPGRISLLTNADKIIVSIQCG
ncbi:Peptidase inhibitor [Pseudomonas sp. IT-196MI5]|uniref:peptidase inhibitor n=1 Tax=unclassified Pseudomonas TaxID=196821 RepID=UPI0039E04F85